MESERFLKPFPKTAVPITFTLQTAHLLIISAVVYSIESFILNLNDTLREQSSPVDAEPDVFWKRVKTKMMMMTMMT